LAYEAYRRTAIDEYWNERKMTAEVRSAIERRKREFSARYRSVSAETLEEIACAAVRRELGAAVPLQTYEDFCAARDGVR
jgi:hypothetical protein